MKSLLSLVLVSALPCLSLAQAPSTPPPLVPKTANQPTEYQAYVYCDDIGELYVNGASVLKATKRLKVFEAKLSLKQGDIITAAVTDQQGGPGGQFAILILKDDKPFVTSKDFRYATEIKPDWMTTPSTAGFRRPELSRLTQVSLGNNKNTQQAWSQPKDRRFATLYFKCIIK